MKSNKNLFVIILSTSLSAILMSGIFSMPVMGQEQDSGIALQRGFRTGYSDGYMAGYRDTIDNIAKDYSRHTEYESADRAYNKDYGALEDYRNGYRQGFESGYDTGFAKLTFQASLPPDLKKRASGTNDNHDQLAISAPMTSSPVIEISDKATSKDQSIPGTHDSAVVPTNQNSGTAIMVIPRDTEMILELQTDLSTQRNREGERFTARIISPSEIAGATVEGRVSKIRLPGRISRRSELLLSFDRILISEDRWSNFSAILTEVMPVKGDNIQRVDTEGTAIGQSSLKQDAIKIGGTTGAGLMVGGVVGGPVGAAVGAGMGAAFGVGAVVIDRGRHVRLNRNQQLRVKTAYETQIR